MGLTTSMYSSLSGLSTNSQSISVTGHNIANLNTPGFKASRLTFETEISQTLGSGSGPAGQLGGTNPLQVGMGTGVGAIDRYFGDGSLVQTGVATDLAIEGNGFFILQLDADQRYTRAGNFQIDRNFNLVSPNGAKVQGYGVDDQFNIIEGLLADLRVPIGSLTLTEATTAAALSGNLNSQGDLAQNGTMINSDTIYSDPGATVQAVPTDTLDSLYDSSGIQSFSTGDVITMTQATKGTATLADRTFEVGPANTTGSDANGQTLQDLIDFLQDMLGIDTAVSGGVSVSAGQIVVAGNTGSANDLVLDQENLVVNQSTNPATPLGFTKTQASDGESARTSFTVYDSLGTPLQVDIALVLEATSNAGTTWRYYAQSDDDSDVDRVLGNGVVTFDTDGAFLAVSDDTIAMDRANTGAATPQQIRLAFQSAEGKTRAYAVDNSLLKAANQDGASIGTLHTFSVNQDGTLVGDFSNGLQRDLGRLAVGTFANPGGLLEEGGNLFNVSANSGIAAVVQPGFGGAGRIVGGTLELSNVELSNEFINMINASTGFMASSRVLTTSDRLIQELLATLR